MLIHAVRDHGCTLIDTDLAADLPVRSNLLLADCFSMRFPSFDAQLGSLFNSVHRRSSVVELNSSG